MSNWRVSFIIALLWGDRVIQRALPWWRCLHPVFASAGRIAGGAGFRTQCSATSH